MLADRLVGQGVTFTNATLTCPDSAAGVFVNSATSLTNMDSGVVLTTGRSINLYQAASVFMSHNRASLANDTNLFAAGGNVTLRDLCKLEFDFIPQGDTVQMRYRFASEEYPEYACTQFNDIFGFFLSGPGITGAINLATVPNTTVPVSINSINSGAAGASGGVLATCTNLGQGAPFPAYYVNNSASTTIIYDAMTTELIAKSAVTACSTYHMKFAIADLGDHVYDSGVFLEANSFTSGNAFFSQVISPPGISYPTPYAIEGCNADTIIVTRPIVKPFAQTLTLQVSGTATSGVDFNTLPTTITIPANQATTRFWLTPIQDFVNEGPETVILKLMQSCGTNTVIDSITITILERPAFTKTPTDTLCLGSSMLLTATPTPANPLLTFLWKPMLVAGNSVTVSPTTATTYTVTSSYPGCPNVDSTVTIRVSPTMTITSAASGVSCSGGSNGAITTSVAGGYAPYAYLWNIGVTNPNPTGMSAGNYTLTVTDIAGCTNTAVVTVTQPIGLQAPGILILSPILCNGGTAPLSLFGLGGTSGYEFAIGTTPTYSNTSNYNLAAGTYTVWVRDANLCTNSTVITLTQPTALTRSVSATAIACNGGNSTITVTAGGGTPSYNYNINGGAFGTSNTFTQPAGTYTIIVRDANLCTTSTTITITQPPVLTRSVSATAIACNGGNSTITVTAGGGTPSYNYNINGGAFGTSNTFTQTAGTYTLIVRDANLCTISTTITITQPTAVTISATSTAIACNGGNTTITVTGGGGVSPYTYAIGATPTFGATNTFTQTAGTYTVWVRDANNCSISTTITRTQPTAVTISASATAISCNGQNTTITVTGSGGTGAYQYGIGASPTFAAGNTFTQAAGTYTVWVRDANNCSLSTTIAITQPTAVTLSVSSTAIACNGGTTTITATSTGGTGAKQYAIGASPTFGAGNTFTQGAGTYTVWVRDANLCSTSSVVTITQPTAIGITASATTILCNAGTTTITVTASGATPAYQYAIGAVPSFGASNSFTQTAGTYTVWARDANNCSISTTISIAQPTAVTIQTVLQHPLCNGGNGQITVNGVGGGGTYTYAIGAVPSFGATNIFTQTAGTYTVWVRDGNNCSSSSNVTLTQPTAVTISATNTAISCNGGNTNITVTAGGGTPSYTYAIGAVPTFGATNIFTQTSGTYTLWVRDANNCSVSTTRTITQPSAVTISASATSITCNGANSTITVTGGGGTGALQYGIGATPTFGATNTFTQTAGTYTVWVRDANNCSISTTIVITQPTAVTIAVSNTSILCNGSTSTITVTGSGGVSPYTYGIGASPSFGASNSFTQSAGTYTVWVRDANFCSISSVISITQPAALTIAGSASAINCNGNNSTITVTAGGGTSPYQYGIGATPTFAGANTFTQAAGTYTVWVRDANLCSISTTITVTQPTAVVISASATPILCNGGNSTITVSGTGGTGAYQYAIGAVPTFGATATFVRTVGTYTVWVRDANNCSQSSVITLTQPTVVNISATATTITCNGGNTTITVTGTGGITPYQYAIGATPTFGAANTFTQTAGTYTVWVNDANGCSKSTVISIAQPSAVGMVVTLSPPSCFGSNGLIDLNGTGGTGAYQYAIGAVPSFSTTNTFTQAAGTYTVWVRDANNCSVSSITTLTQPPAVTISASGTSIICSGGNSSITVTGGGGTPGYQYGIGAVPTFGASNTFTQPSGTYTVWVRDANNCSVSTTISITQTAAVTTTATATSILCSGGTSTITVTGTGGTPPYTYAIGATPTFGASNTFTGTAATYTVWSMDANGCSASTVVVVTQPSGLTVKNNLTPILCYGGTSILTILPSGGVAPYQFAIGPPPLNYTTQTNYTLTAGTYTIYVKDANNCVKTGLIVIGQPNLIVASATNTPITCNGGTSVITASATGGLAPYLYDVAATPTFTSATTYTVTGGGVYTVYAQDANNCSVSTTITITQPPAITVAVTSTTPPTCVPGNDGTIAITASGGTGALTYQRGSGASQASTVFTSVPAGVHVMTATDANGCTGTTLATVVNASSPNITSLVIAPFTCWNDTTAGISITATSAAGGISYTLTSPTQTNTTGNFNSLAPATYTITVNDASNCTNSTVVALTAPTQPTVTAVATPIACNGGSAVIYATATGGTGAFTYALNSGTFTIYDSFVVVAGTYTVRAQDAFNCSASTVITLTQPPLLTLSQTASAIACNGQQSNVVLSATGGTPLYQYALNAGAFSTTSTFNLSVGTYTFTVKDVENCTSSTTLSITQPPVLSVTASGTSITCNGATTNVVATGTGGAGALQYSLNGLPYSAINSWTVAAGSYTIIVRDANNCTNSTTLSITQPTAINISTTVPAIPCFGGSTTITASATGGSPSYTYSIGGAPGTVNTFVVNANTYTLVVTDASGCTMSSVVVVTQPLTVTSTITNTSISCFGGLSTITVNGANGTPPYQFGSGASPFYTSTNTFVEPAGTYTLWVKDANGCAVSSTRTITQPTSVLISSSYLAISCNGGTTTITVLAAGGTPGYQYGFGATPSFSSTNTFPVTAGTYTIWAQDANSCSKSATVTIAQPSVVTLTVNTSAITCNGNTSTVVLSGGGGTGSYQYAIGATPTFANNNTYNLSSGTYTLWVRDGGNCSTSTVISITQPPLLTLTRSATAILCNGGNSTITATASGGVSPYQYAIGAVPTYGAGNTFTQTAGTYTVWARDANQCTRTTTITITQPTVVSVTASAPALTCNGGNVTITATASGGVPAYTYAIGATPIFASGNTFSASAGTYTLWTSDANSCSSSTVYAITQPSTVGISASATAILCNGNSSTITVNGSGGVPSYQYALGAVPSFSASNTFTSLAGTYTVWVRDANLCSISTTISITQPTILGLTASATSIACNGGQSTISASATGGVTAYQYSLNGGAFSTASSFTVSAGSYNITVQDANGCTRSTSLSIAQPSALLITSTASSIACHGGLSGITLGASGGTPNYQYAVGTTPFYANNNNFSEPAGTYTLWVRDANNCTATTVITITEPTQVAIGATATAVTCNGGLSTITISASGGVPSYTYAQGITPSFTNSNTLSVAAGTYTVWTRDANLCSVSTSITITQPTIVQASASSTNILCNGGVATISVAGTGGVSPYNYGIGATPSFSATSTFSQGVGTYTVWVRDANNCSASTTIALTQPATVLASAASTSILCSGGNSTITVSGTGGVSPYSYAIGAVPSYGAGNTFTQAAGTYTVWVRDANLCVSSATITITQPTQVVASASAPAILCNVGTSVIAALGNGGTPAYQYAIGGVPVFGASNTFTQGAGTYTIWVRDANSCSASTTIVLTQPTQVVASASATAILCNGNNTTITASGNGGVTPYQYALGATPVFGLSSTFTTAAGTYTVWVSDANNCSASTTINITQPSTLQMTATNAAILCNGGNATITLAATGGVPSYNYNINGGAYAATNTFVVTTGTYTLSARDNNLCSVTTVLTITQPATLTATTSVPSIVCNGGSTNIVVSASGGVPTYIYSSNTAPATTSNNVPATAGSYTVMVQDANGCTFTSAVVVTQPNAVAISVSATNILCFGGTSTITSSATGGVGGYTYSLNGGAYAATSTFVVTSGIHTVIVQDANGCTSGLLVNAVQPSQVTASLVVAPVPCAGGVATVTVVPNGGILPYQYSDGGAFGTSTIYFEPAGNYTFTVQDANACTGTVSVTISQPSALGMSVSNTPILCYGGTTVITATASGGSPAYQYSIDGGVANFSNSFSTLGGTYTIQALDAQGCTISSVVTIAEPAEITPQYTTTTILCNGQSSTITILASGGVGPYEYAFTGYAFSSNNVFTATAGTYTATIRDANLCVSTFQLSLLQPSVLTASASQTNILCNSGIGNLIGAGNGGSPPYQYSIDNVTFQTNDSFAVTAGTYTLYVKDVNDCVATTSISVTQPSNIIAQLNPTSINCYGGTSNFSISAIGGVPPYEYSLNGSAWQTSNQFLNQLAGTYTVIVRDANLCTMQLTATVNQPSPVQILPSIVGIACYGDVTDVLLNATGGSAPYSYALDSSSFFGVTSFDNLSAGVYTLQVQDDYGCQHDTILTITQPAPVTATATKFGAVCNGNGGQIAAGASGGTMPFQYSLNGGILGSLDTFVASGVGTYTVLASDANGCTGTSTVTLNITNTLTIKPFYTPVACNGGLGGIVAIGLGGTAPYMYSLNGAPFQSSNTFNNLLAGAYTIVATDANGCIGSTVALLGQPNPITINATVNDALCNGGLGSIFPTANGGVGSFTYTVNGAPIGAGYFVAGTYTIVATDVNLCTQSTVVTISEPTAIVTSINAGTAPCATDSALVTTSVSNGTAPYTIAFDGAITGLSYAWLPVGTHTITTSDANACSVNDTITITFQDNIAPGIQCPPNLNFSATASACYVSGIALGSPNVWDNCGVASFSNNWGSANFVSGINTVTWTVVDINGNSNTCLQEVIVSCTDSITITPPCPSCIAGPVCIAQTPDTNGNLPTVSVCGSSNANWQIIGPDTSGCFIFIPLVPEYNGGNICLTSCLGSVCDTIYVTITPPITPDTVVLTPACPTCPVVACQIFNDVPNSGSAQFYNCGVVPFYTATPADVNGCVTYTGNGLASNQQLTCQVVCDNGMCDTTYVIVNAPITPDTIIVGPTNPGAVTNVCVVADDITLTGSSTYYTCGSQGNVVVQNTGNGCYDISAILPGQGGQTCIVACENGLCDTTIVIVLPPLSTDTVIIQPTCIGCTFSACAITTDMVIDATTTYAMCTTPVGYSNTTIDANGCWIAAATTNTASTTNCIVACTSGVCDTTIVIVLPPITPDTVTVIPQCPTCNVIACVVADDVIVDANTSFLTCGAVGYNVSAPTSVGCVVFEPITTQVPNTVSCIVACNYGICDTTYVIIAPPITPDTLVIKPACVGCPIVACPIFDDITYDSTVTFSSCGAPAGFTVPVMDSLGCLSFSALSDASSGTTCIISCKDGICDTTVVVVLKPITPDSIFVTPACPTCSVTACVVADDLSSLVGASYASCINPNINSTGPTPSGCYTFNLTPGTTTAQTTCIVACVGGLCDTTIVVIDKPITPDTLTVTPSCLTCPVNICAIFNDVPLQINSTFTTCGMSPGYTSTPIDLVGCMHANSNGTLELPGNTCIVHCADGLCDTTYVVIELANSLPMPDINVVLVNQLVVGDVSTNDLQWPSSSYAVDTSYASNPTTDVPTMNLDGTYSFIASTTGVYYYLVTLCDQSGACNKAELKISVVDTTIVQAPVINTDIAVTLFNTPVVINTLANDTSMNAADPLNPASITIQTPPVYGFVTINASTGEISYLPQNGFVGTDTIVYEVCTSISPVKCDKAMQIITVLGPDFVNTVIASDDFVTGSANSPALGNVLLNDADPEGNVMTVSPQNASLPGIGLFAIDDLGNYIFTPDPGFSGSFNISYEVCDNNTIPACANATVYFYYQPVPVSNLPIDYVKLFGEVESDYDKLKWETIGEYKNNYFVLERSVDSVVFTDDRAIINTQAPNGTSSQLLKYAYNEPQYLFGNSYYRLRIVAQDNSISYSNIVKLSRYKADSYLWLPNPVVTDAFVDIYVNQPSGIEVKLLDAAGKLVNITRAQCDPGQHKIIVPMQHIATGVYHVQIFSNGVMQHNLVVLKQP
jgi:hypothetical protein